MQCTTVKCSNVQFITVKCSTVQCSSLQCSTVQLSPPVPGDSGSSAVFMSPARWAWEGGRWRTLDGRYGGDTSASTVLGHIWTREEKSRERVRETFLSGCG